MVESKLENTIEIRDIFSIILRRKWLILGPIVLVAIIAYAGSYLIEKRYQSSTMIAIAQANYLSRQLQAMVPGEENPQRTRQEITDRLIAIRNELISSVYLARLIDELNLGKDPKVAREVQKLATKWPDIPPEQLTYRFLMEQLRQDISVSFNGENIVEISVESSNPGRAMAIAAKLAQIFKEERLKRELSGVRGALDFSDEQLAIYKANLEQAERKKAELAANYLKDQLDESVSADSNVRNIMADIDNTKLLVDDNIKEQAAVRAKLITYHQSQLVLESDKDYDRLKESIFAETQKLADFMPKYMWSDPKVLNANLNITRQMKELDNVIARIVKRQFSSATSDEQDLLTEYFSLQAQEIVLRQKLGNFEVALSILRNRIARQPQYEIQMRSLENEVLSARSVYEKFKDQLTGSEISQSLMRGESESKYRVVEPASLPLAPINPNRMKILVLGLILGGITGGASALLAELLDKSFKTVEDVESYLGTPVLATIPKIASPEKK